MPSPRLPVVGTQNRFWRSVAPHSDSAAPGPGTLVITAVVLREKRLRIASWAGLTSWPATASTA